MALDNAPDQFDVYVQRVTASGMIAPGWPGDGVPVCTNPEIQDAVGIAPDGAGGVYVAWQDTRDYFVDFHRRDIYLQRVTHDGSIPPGWSLDGIPVHRDR